jgi:hypothetical protein
MAPGIFILPKLSVFEGVAAGDLGDLGASSASNIWLSVNRGGDAKGAGTDPRVGVEGAWASDPRVGEEGASMI